MKFCDEQEWGFGWMVEERMQRCSHALVIRGKVWLLDPLRWDEAERRIRALGEPRGVIQLLDRHKRDCALLAAHFRVPLHVTPSNGVPAAPFRVIPIQRNRLWKEIALWWPEQRVLACGDALGTSSYYLAPGAVLATHPLLRLFPPKRLGGVEPRHILCGHGAGVHGEDASGALHEALETSARKTPRWLVHTLRAEIERRRRG